MEQATLPQERSTGGRRTSPPGSRAPALVQAFRYLRDPLGLLASHQRRYGDVFTIRFPVFGHIVYVARPDFVKEVFTGAPSVFHAGEANATVLEPALGPNSVLTLDDEPHLRQRKLLLPPFHGERVQRYGELIVELTREEMKSWPRNEAVRDPPAHAADHARGDHARRLRRPRPRAAGPSRSADRRVRAAGRDDHRLPLHCAATSAASAPGAASSARASELDAFIYEEIALRRAEPGYEERDDVLSLLLTARDEEGEPMSDRELRDELVTVLAAGHETTATGLAWAVERLTRNPEVLAEAARLDRRRRGGLPERDREGDAAGAAGDRRRRPQADRAGRPSPATSCRPGPSSCRRSPPSTTARTSSPNRTASGPSASSTARPTTTPGSRSAAASAAASAPPSPNTRCGRSCASSSPAPSCAPPGPGTNRCARATSPSSRQGQPGCVRPRSS